MGFGEDDSDEDSGPSYFGFVREVDGAGISDAKVTAALKDRGALVTRTDIMGVYKILGLRQGHRPKDITISCAKEGYKQASVERRPAKRSERSGRNRVLPSEAVTNSTFQFCAGWCAWRGAMRLAAIFVLCLGALPAISQTLSGSVSSAEEGAMEGVLVSAQKDGSPIIVTVVSDEHGGFRFPDGRLSPGHYTLRIRAVGSTSTVRK